MARRRAPAKPAGLVSLYEEAVSYFQTELAKPAPPVETYLYPPVRIGPTWQTTDDGHWLLPERTLGWQVIGWCAEWLQHEVGKPWRFTLEQARFILWWYAVDEAGQFLARDAILQRLKGWGKDPLGACLCAVEAIGPCRFSGEWDEDGQPLATDNPVGWVQTAAVAMEQTKNTMKLFPLLFTKEAVQRYGIVVGKEKVHFAGGRLIEAVTSSPSVLQGARATFVLLNETQHWLASNNGHEMAAVIEDNATKSPDGAARTLRITNAYEPSEDSVGQHDREGWEQADSGHAVDTGIMYDSLEAPPEAPLTAEAAPEVVRAIRGDSVWLNLERIAKSILDVRHPPSRSRRFWYNQITANEDAWVDPQRFDLLAATDTVVGPRDEIVLFFDGSKSDDATALMGCRLSDGHCITLGMWQKPPRGRDEGWVVPRLKVDQRVDEVFKTYNVIAFWGDPSHALDDETEERYWDSLIDGWHRKYKDRLRHWAIPGAERGHSIMWDMTSPKRSAEFTGAAEIVSEEIDHAPKALEAGEPLPFTHDGDGRLVRHVRNARRFPNKWGTSLWKGHRESPKKIDLAVALVGARMLRRNVLNATQSGKRAGRVWFPNAR